MQDIDEINKADYTKVFFLKPITGQDVINILHLAKIYSKPDAIGPIKCNLADWIYMLIKTEYINNFKAAALISNMAIKVRPTYIEIYFK